MGQEERTEEERLKMRAIHVGSRIIEDKDGVEHRCTEYGEETESGAMRQQQFKCVECELEDCDKVFKEVWAHVGILDTDDGEYLKERLGERVVGPLN